MALAALSGGFCYWPGCPEPMLRRVPGGMLFVGQFCHIRGTFPGGARYDPAMSDDDRRGIGNLLLLCKAHHEVVDMEHPEQYPVETLLLWKAQREASPRGVRTAMMTNPPGMIGNHVFISYSHDDRTWLNRLLRTLKPLVREGDIQVFSDTDIRPGADWMREINSALDNARVAILLISTSFLNSDFIMNRELPVLLDRANNGDVTIMPVIVGPSLYDTIPSLVRFQAVNPTTKPLSDLRRPQWEKVLVDLAYEVKRVAG